MVRASTNSNISSPAVNELSLTVILPILSEEDPSGQTNGIQFWGRSFVAGPQGELLLELGQSEEMTIVDVDLVRSERVRRWWPFLRDRRIDAFEGLTKRFLD